MVLALGFYFAPPTLCFCFVFAWFVLLCYEAQGDGVISLGNSAKKAFEDEFLLKPKKGVAKVAQPAIGYGKVGHFVPCYFMCVLDDGASFSLS